MNSRQTPRRESGPKWLRERSARRGMAVQHSFLPEWLHFAAIGMPRIQQYRTMEHERTERT